MPFFSFLPWGKQPNRAGDPKRGVTGRGPSPVGLADQHSVPGRGPQGEVHPEEAEATSAFLLGVSTPVSSSWVQDLTYDIETQTLTVGYHSKNGTVIKHFEYHNVPPEMAESFLFSPSKGAWANLHLKKAGWPYVQVGSFSGKVPFHD